MVARGKFYLYDSIVPPLSAGSYKIRSTLDVDVTDNTSLPVAPHDMHFNVTAPRLKLPPDQALMTFPPANSEGAYEARLPQIVLRKRTLPWDRRAAAAGTVFHGQTVEDTTPWMALVVIAEGEGEIKHDQPWEECITPPKTLTGNIDTPRASYLSVPQSTVDKIFPTVQDLSLLTHVREVNPDDTENAMGDEDGFLAVVIANRMPQYDTVNCKPKAYTACLINLENQLDVLPAPAPPRPFYEMADLFLNGTVATYAASVSSGTAVPQKVSTDTRLLDLSNAGAMADAVRRGEVVFHNGTLIDRAGATSDGLNVLGRMDSISFLDGDFSTVARATDAAAQPQVRRVEGTFSGFNFPLDRLFAEKFYRFPVLTSWRFTCAGAGSFQQLMSSLDVGLLGTVAEGGYERALPDCVPEVTGDDPGAAPVTQLPLEMAETGHVGLPHLTRTGENANAWYRGAFSPHQLLRNPLAEEAQFPVLAHISDHLRMMTPDGREDVSLAVAFETGRLLAMSQPSFVAALQRWRAERFGASRARVSQETVFRQSTDILGTLINDFDNARILDAIRAGLIPQLLESGIIAALDLRRDRTISTPVELVTPGVKAQGLAGDFNGFLAEGLGMDRALVDQIAAQPDNLDAFAQLQASEPGRVSTAEIDLNGEIETQLDDVLSTGLVELAQTAIGAKDIRADTVKDLSDFSSLDSFVKDRFERN
ncbi:hypothetical protein [uncultured Roseobacter sp.]|uniref:hypothetical protein n=1 Tax=uncultured Roseobacter sp. TaxID=114847 RepID=UPI00262BC82F|nr:hypothetical protein [uncultured Roseobacter sp.]